MRGVGRDRGARWLATLILALGTVVATAPAHTHEIPTNVVVRAYLVPGPEQTELLLRVPFEAMRDLDVPLRGPGYIDIDAAAPLLNDAAETWLANFIDLYVDGQRLDEWRLAASRLSLPSDRSFNDYERARQHVTTGTLSADTDIYRDQALMDVLLSYPGAQAGAEVAIEPRFAQLGLQTTTVLNFVPEQGTTRVFEFRGNPGVVPLDPRWHQAFLRFVKLGVDHILVGIDHILFLLCLIVPFRRLRPLVAIVTSFTVAHSITLVASAAGFAPRAPWFPPLVEMLIAASIVYMAVENLVGSRWERRWLIAFGFGLVHGFGFSFALGETLQFAGSHLVASLLAFNLGVELGQLLLIAVAVPALNLLFRTARAERIGTWIISGLLAHSGWHWMTERAGALLETGYTLPRFDAGLLAAAMRVCMLLIVIALAVWLLSALARRLAVSGTGSGNES